MKVFDNFDLSSHTRWKIGGKVARLYIVENIDELKCIITEMNSKGINYLIIGNTSNLLFTDDYIDGALIYLAGEFNRVEIEDDKIRVGSGVFAPRLAKICISHQLEGLEHIVGIPASIGGLITMNGGSNRKSISENVNIVKSLSQEGNEIIRNYSECEFGYRESIFKYNREVILGCEIELTKSSKNLRSVCLSILKDRRLKFPIKTPNCGSVFKSNPEMYQIFGPPGKIVEELGFKGFRIGGASISKQHANFIINDEGAKAVDVIEIIDTIKAKVKDKTGFDLCPEVRLVDKNLEFKEL